MYRVNRKRSGRYRSFFCEKHEERMRRKEEMRSREEKGICLFPH
jgi:hypothetical protein